MMTETTPDLQTCPFCYTEMNARTEVCPNCQAVKEITPAWVERLKAYGMGVGLVLLGLFLTFVDGRTVNWWAVPIILFGAFFLSQTHKVEVPDAVWH